MLDKAIPSKEYRTCIQENNVKLTDWDLATLIYNNTELNYNEKMDVLSELSNNTQDETLSCQIKERLSDEKQLINDFSINNGNAYFSLHFESDMNYKAYGVYKDFESAFFDGKEENEKFFIVKKCYDDEEKKGNIKGTFGSIHFNSGGTIGNEVYVYRMDDKDAIDVSSKPRFEMRPLDLPLFFRTGDIVRIIGTDMYGIVDSPDDDKKEERMRILAASGDYYDFQVPVNTMFDGEKYLSVFSHEHVAPSLLEYAKLDDNDIRKGFLQYMVKTLYQSAWFGNGGRDESRIPMVLSMLETIWKQYPDLRLGQLLIDVCGPKDLFSMEDEELLAYFQKNKWGEIYLD